MKIVDISVIGSAVASELAGRTEPPRLVVSGNFGTPQALLAAIDAALPEYRLYAINAQPCVPDRPGVTLETSFVGVGMRRKPTLSYVPSRLSLVPTLFRRTLPPDVVVVHTSAVHEGKVSLGMEVNILPGAIEAVKERGGLVIAQINRNMPYTFGDGEYPIEEIDLAVEVDEPLASPHHGAPDEASAKIGALVASRVGDGATLQLGIGAVPDAVLLGLLDRHDLKVWSEMFSDGVLELEKAGAMDTATPITASFLFGSPALYAWVDRNPRVVLLRTETTNEPAEISKNPLMTSVNTALQVDLFGQANASRINARIYSGFGGQTDFIVGALHSPGGQSLMALRSWHPKADVSTIIPLVDEPVTSFQPTAVVTEQGIAEIFGHSEKDQAAHLIQHAAHPLARAELLEEARALGLA